MPYINVRIVKGASNEQKEQVIKEITDTLVRVLGKNPASTFVVIDEVEATNWGKGGETIANINNKLQ